MIKKLLALLLLIPSLVFGASATFTADTTTQMINPERGWYVTPKDSEMVTSTLLSFVSQYQTRLMFYNIALDALQGTDTIPGATITTLNGYFAQARAAGVKMVVIVSYGTTTPTTPVARMVLHAQQLQAFFYTNRDIIAFVEAGFIGAYGEWSDPNATLSMKTQVRDAVMAMVPPEIMVSFTNVYTQMNWYPTALTAAHAFTGGPQARMGWQNDCFLSGPTDSFQFPGPTTVADQTVTTSQLTQRQYMQAISEYVPSGGETSVTSCNTPARTGCISGTSDGAGQTGGIMNEGPRIHLAWLHYPASDSQTLIDSWNSASNSGPCFTSIANLLGYRLQLDSVSHADTVTHGTTLTITVNLRNYGWSRFFKERRLRARLHPASGSDITCTSANDLRKLPSQATSSTAMQIKCAIPSGATLGSYTLDLSAPDTNSALASIRAYMVRFANANSGGQTWDDTNGRFATGTTVTVN